MINLDEGCKWEITNVTQRRRVESYSCNSNDTYEDIHYSITVKRKIPTYHSVIVVPALGMHGHLDFKSRYSSYKKKNAAC